MNKQTILSSILSVALLSLTACHNDNNETDDKAINIAKSIEFKVDFADYNAEQEVGVTRTGNEIVKLEQKMVDLGNGILAQCTLQRDTARQARHDATRVIPNDTYTMLAYDAATHTFKGELTGTVSYNTFTPTSTNKSIRLAPGTYDFVLFNSKVSRNGDNLTVTRTDADAALIGRTQQVITATPYDQKVAFTLKHVGAKVKIKFKSYMDFKDINATLASVNATDIPGSSVYNASTGTWNAGSGTAISVNLTSYGNSRPGEKGTSVGVTDQEIVFMPATDVSKLKLSFTGGNVYGIEIGYLPSSSRPSFTFAPTSPLVLEQNGSYVLIVDMKYRFLYLMSNGDVGPIEETTFGGGAKTPVGVVISQSQHLAVALENADGSNKYKWTTNNQYYNNPANTTKATTLAGYMALVNGHEETWDASCSTTHVTGNKIKGENADFPAFKLAAEYSPTLPTGVNISGTLIGRKWHLPAFGEWVYLYKLGRGNTSQNFSWSLPYYWSGEFAYSAFRQVDGTPPYWLFWTSTENMAGYAGLISCTGQAMAWGYHYQGNEYFIRPFIKYAD